MFVHVSPVTVYDTPCLEKEVLSSDKLSTLPRDKLSTVPRDQLFIQKQAKSKQSITLPVNLQMPTYFVELVL